jgi:hypothetical protein
MPRRLVQIILQPMTSSTDHTTLQLCENGAIISYYSACTPHRGLRRPRQRAGHSHGLRGAPGTNASVLDGVFLTYIGLIAGNYADPAKFTVSKAMAAEFPALLGQSVSYAALVFCPGTVNPPHVHPRASELLT